MSENCFLVSFFDMKVSKDCVFQSSTLLLINRKSCVFKSIRFGTERFESLSFQLLNALRQFLSLRFQRVFLEVFIFNRLEF